jgi:hypothetical protein
MGLDRLNSVGRRTAAQASSGTVRLVEKTKALDLPNRYAHNQNEGGAIHCVDCPASHLALCHRSLSAEEAESVAHF